MGGHRVSGAETWLQISVGIFCAGVLYVLIQTLFKESIEAYENSTFKRVSKGVKNPRRVRDALLRIAFLTLALVLWYPAVLVYVELHQQVLLLSYPLILADDGRAVSGGVRPPAAFGSEGDRETPSRRAGSGAGCDLRLAVPGSWCGVADL